MRKSYKIVAGLMVAGMLAAPAGCWSGPVGRSLARYSIAGAGIGTFLGAAAATIPYLNDHQPFDFMVGAGVGMLTGAGIGFIFGAIDLATAGQEEAGLFDPRPGPALYCDGKRTVLAWNMVF